MMTDQFSVQLRRHLLDTADERPADGRLEAVVERTLGMPQRLPWLARLRWRLDPIAPFNNPWLRYGAVVLSLLLLAGLALIAAGGSGPPARTVFEGTWTSTDTADRSTQTLVIGPGQNPTVHFEDDYSISCQRRGETSTVYSADGTAEITGDRLVFPIPAGGCTRPVPAYTAFYDYDAATGTLLDYQSIRWVIAP
jgi:hypothetical protein